MNGLTAADVSQLSNALLKSIEKLFEQDENVAANELRGMLNVIEIMQQQNATTQASRPDRVGDECWFRTGGDWQKGILRVWDVGCECSMAIVEDKETGVAKSTTDISFSIEAPK
jgi:hypothetical protein